MGTDKDNSIINTENNPQVWEESYIRPSAVRLCQEVAMAYMYSTHQILDILGEDLVPLAYDFGILVLVTL